MDDIISTATGSLALDQPHLHRRRHVVIAMSAVPSGPEWLAYLAAELGTDKWVVASRLTERLKDKGHALAVTPKRYKTLQDTYNALQGAAKAEAMLAELRKAAGEACALLGSGSSARDREAEANLKDAISRLAAELAKELSA